MVTLGNLLLLLAQHTCQRGDLGAQRSRCHLRHLFHPMANVQSCVGRGLPGRRLRLPQDARRGSELAGESGALGALCFQCDLQFAPCSRQGTQLARRLCLCESGRLCLRSCRVRRCRSAGLRRLHLSPRFYCRLTPGRLRCRKSVRVRLLAATQFRLQLSHTGLRRGMHRSSLPLQSLPPDGFFSEVRLMGLPGSEAPL